ncbi:MAG: hypothetical protein Q4A60_02305 [Pasteurellaceae bacterium]|nr:hypothetical protein [Pasteurellaceae bacterium]
MKLVKILTMISLSGLLSVSMVQAATGVAKPVLAKNPQTQQRSELQQFSDAFSLRFINAMAEDQQGRIILKFKYQLENRSTKAIKSVHWATYYTYNNQILLTQDLPLSFNNFQPNTRLPVDFSIAWDELPKIMQETIADSSKQIVPQYQAKSIEFIDGSRIEVK